jgi:hypothetical protein
MGSSQGRRRCEVRAGPPSQRLHPAVVLFDRGTMFRTALMTSRDAAALTIPSTGAACSSMPRSSTARRVAEPLAGMGA